MDPFTSVTTVLTAVGMVLKASHEITTMVQGVRTAPVQVQRLVDELRDLYSLLGAFQALLDRQSEEYSDDTITEMLRNLQTLLHNCLNVLKDVRSSLSSLIRPDGTAGVSFWRGVQYAAFKRSDIVVLQQTLGSYKAMLSMSYSALNVMYASDTNNIAKRIDDNTTRFDERLGDIQIAVKRLEHQFDRKEHEERARERQLQDQGLAIETELEDEQEGEITKRLSIAGYNFSLRESLRSLESIISSPSPSRAASLIAPMDDVDPATSSALDVAAKVEERLKMEIDEVSAAPLEGGESAEEEASTPTDESNTRMSDALLEDVDFIMGSGLKLNSLRLSDTDVWEEDCSESAKVSDTIGQPESDAESHAARPVTPEESLARSHAMASDEDRDTGTSKTVTETLLDASSPPHSGMEPVTPLLKTESYPEIPENWFPSYRSSSGKKAADALVQQLKDKVVDWKGHYVGNFGDLLLYDVLQIKKDQLTQTRHQHPYHSFLFEKILICCKVISYKAAKKGFSWEPPAQERSPNRQGTFAYKMKGRIQMRDITSIKRPNDDVEIFWHSPDSGGSTCLLRFDDPAVRTEWALCLGTQAHKWRPATRKRPVGVQQASF